MKELIAAYDEYVRLLATSEAGLMAIAFVHGYSVPDDVVASGEELRARIAKLRRELGV